MASNGTYGGERTFPIGSDLTNFQYYIGKLDSTGHVIPATAATDALIGIIQQNPVSVSSPEVEYANVALLSYPGTLKVIAGGTIAIGDRLTTNASSQAIATTSVGNILIGQALHAAVSGDLVEFLPYNGKF